MYTGDYGPLFGVTKTPYVTYVVNPDLEISKVFDALLVPSSVRMQGFEMSVNKGHDMIYQTTTGDLDTITRGESNYRTKVLRSGSGSRMRGLYATVGMNWHDISDGVLKNISVTLPSVLTKYRHSENRF